MKTEGNIMTLRSSVVKTKSIKKELNPILIQKRSMHRICAFHVLRRKCACDEAKKGHRWRLSNGRGGDISTVHHQLH